MTMDDDEYFPNIGSTGSAHSIREESDPAPWCAGFKSVKNAQGGALRPRQAAQRNPVGFWTGPKR